MKNNQLIFDHTFNTEIVKVSSAGLLSVLNVFFDLNEIEKIEKAYEKTQKADNAEVMRCTFKKAANDFAKAAAQKAGTGAFSTFKSITIGTL